MEVMESNVKTTEPKMKNILNNFKLNYLPEHVVTAMLAFKRTETSVCVIPSLSILSLKIKPKLCRTPITDI